jgi:hypothetical protein
MKPFDVGKAWEPSLVHPSLAFWKTPSSVPPLYSYHDVAKADAWETLPFATRHKKCIDLNFHFC